MVKNWGAYRKKLNCGRGNHHFVRPRSGKTTYKICDKCQSHQMIKRKRRK